MTQFGLIGYPLTHSYSKRFFSEKFIKENIKGCKYEHFSLPDIQGFTKLVDTNPNIKGLNVTIPYKESIIPFLDDLDATVINSGAVNTIKIFRQHDSVKLIGYNTDIYGFSGSLKPLLKQFHRKALILGTGGAAKTVAFTLGMLGIEYKFISRDPKDSNQISYRNVDKTIIQTHQLIINATPVGMFPDIESYPDIPYKYLTKRHLLFDLIYNPQETKFLHFGKENNAKIQNGLLMLHLQAEKSWKIWNNL